MRRTKETGITLIALVITIIVLLILAGVAINLTVGDNGIFKRTQESVQIYENAANNEATELNTAVGEMDKLILGMTLDIQYTSTQDSITVQVNGVKATGYIFSIKKVDEENYTAMPEQTESTYTFTGLEDATYKIKIEIKTETVTLEREIEVTTVERTIPDLATINFSKEEVIIGETTTATVTQTDGQSGVNIRACKWVYNTTSTEIGIDESLYIGGNFNSTTQDISLTETKAGTYYLHVLTVDNVGNKRETISTAVAVVKPVEKITLNKTSTTLVEGGTEKLTATVTPSDATNKTIEWSSSDTTVATVSEGIITANAGGTTVITATATDGSGVSATCSVTVERTTLDVFEYLDSTGITGDEFGLEVNYESSGGGGRFTRWYNPWKIGVQNETMESVSCELTIPLSSLSGLISPNVVYIDWVWDGGSVTETGTDIYLIYEDGTKKLVYTGSEGGYASTMYLGDRFDLKDSGLVGVQVNSWITGINGKPYSYVSGLVFAVE